MTESHLLEVNHLTVSFPLDGEKVTAVDDVSFHLKKGEVLGIVGESGSGKSLTSLAIMGLIPQPPAIIEKTEIMFQGQNLLALSDSKMRKIRGNQISMIFQEPMTSLNPLFTIGDQLIEAVRLHTKSSKSEAYDRCITILQLVGLARSAAIMKEYPHQLSGGMRQRIMIAMAMVCQPRVLIADEPTTALDVTIQSQILALMKDLNEKTETSIIFITHDLGVVAEICNRVLVMYAGKIVEEGEVIQIFKNPQHPYTKGLLKSVPDIRKKDTRLYSIPGNVPKPGSVKTGCLFAPRCEYAFSKCISETPQLLTSDVDQHHKVRCFLYENNEKEVLQHVGTVTES